MPRYYFHIIRPDSRISDDEGAQFQDFATAKHEALISLTEVLAEASRQDDEETGFAIEVCDQNGRLLATFHRGDVQGLHKP